jgi:hypothetical protein
MISLVSFSLRQPKLRRCCLNEASDSCLIDEQLLFIQWIMDLEIKAEDDSLNRNLVIHEDSGAVNIWEMTDLYVRLIKWKCFKSNAGIGLLVCSSAEFTEEHIDDASVASFMKALSLIDETASSFFILESAFLLPV